MNPGEKRPADGEAVRPEGFAGRNVKIITFFVCMVIFFAFFGPLSFFRIRDCAEKKQSEALPELSVENMIDFAHDPTLLTMTRLRTYRGTWNEGDRGNTFSTQFGHYIFLAYEDRASGRITFCEVTDVQTDKRLDLLDKQSDPNGFFGK